MSKILNEEMVFKIHKMAADGTSQTDIGKCLGVSQTAISDIARGKTWSHLGLGKIRFVLPARERLLSGFRINESNRCWEWIRLRDSNGYGIISISPKDGHKSKSRLAHRLSYEIHKGPIPDGLHVLHSCDNPCCINPDHLNVGTQPDNIREAMERGRMARGERSGTSKLTNDQVIQIVSMRSGGSSVSEIAAAFDMDNSAIYYLLRGDTWNHVTGLINAPRNKKAKLNKDQVLEIVELHKSGKHVRDLSEMFSISKSSIFGIISGKYWSSVTGITSPKLDSISVEPSSVKGS